LCFALKLPSLKVNARKELVVATCDPALDIREVVERSHVTSPTVRESEQALALCSMQSSDLLFHDLFHAVFHVLGFSSALALAINARGHAGDDAHTIIHQIVIRVFRKNHLYPPSLHGY